MSFIIKILSRSYNQVIFHLPFTSSDSAASNDLTKVQEIGSNQEDSIALSSNSQRRSQRAIKRKKFDDEVVSTEPGVISATAAAAAASTVTNMETTTHELDTKEVLFKQFIHLALITTFGHLQ